MEFKFINDLHILGPLESHTYEQLLEEIKQPNTYLLGDIIDLKNCHKKDVDKAKRMIDELKKLVPFIGGNHCLGYGDLPNYYMIEGKYFFTHGHLYTNFEKYSKWDKKQPGAGWFKRNVITPAIDSMRRFLEVRPNEELKNNIRNLKLQYPHLTDFVMGHSHIPETKIFMIEGVRVHMLQRGVNYVRV